MGFDWVYEALNQAMQYTVEFCNLYAFQCSLRKQEYGTVKPDFDLQIIGTIIQDDPLHQQFREQLQMALETCVIHATDRRDGFHPPAPPSDPDVPSLTWGIWKSWWEPKWEWESDWQWESDEEWMPDYDECDEDCDWDCVIHGHCIQIAFKGMLHGLNR